LKDKKLTTLQSLEMSDKLMPILP